MMKSKGTAMLGLLFISLHEMMITLPPLGEQKRIVAKIEELLPYCNQLIKEEMIFNFLQVFELSEDNRAEDYVDIW